MKISKQISKKEKDNLFFAGPCDQNIKEMDNILFVFLFRFHDNTCNIHAYEKRIILQ
jgi:hypothetical protein